MIFRETDLPGVFVIDLERLEDERGWFARAWDRDEFARRGLDPNLVQCNVSFNRKRGTLRGMHLQTGAHAESKLVRCTRGRVYDVVVDLRRESVSHARWIGAELSADNARMLYVPAGCAHGYQVLEDASEVVYQVSAFYAREAEAGVRWNDPSFAIDWPIPEPTAMSEKDRTWPDYRGGGSE